MALWEHNLFGRLVPWLGDAMASEFVRGGVTGVGIVTAIAGLRDLTGAFFSRRSVATGERDRGQPM